MAQAQIGAPVACPWSAARLPRPGCTWLQTEPHWGRLAQSQYNLRAAVDPQLVATDHHAFDHAAPQIAPADARQFVTALIGYTNPASISAPEVAP